MERNVWCKAAASNNGGNTCVEVRMAEDGSVTVADTKQNGEGPVLEFNAAEWSAFLQGVRTDEWVPSRP